MLIEEYFPINKMHKLEQELRKLNMKGAGIAAYTSRFNDHVTLCPSFVTFEYKKIERYIWGLAWQIQRMVKASRPATLDGAKRLAYVLTDQVVCQGTLVHKADTETVEIINESSMVIPGETWDNPYGRNNMMKGCMLQQQPSHRSNTLKTFPSVISATTTI